MLKHGTVEQEDTHVTTVPAPCAGFGARVEVAPLSGMFEQRWAACGAGAVRTIQIPEEERLRGAPFRALWGRSIFVLG